MIKILMARWIRSFLFNGLLLSAVALVFGLYCRSLNIHVNPFRAESGMWLQMVFAPAATQWELIRLSLSSYNGHYLPIVFLAEFVQAKIFGTNELLWFWRQMLVVGMFGIACASFAYYIARTVLPTAWAVAFAFGTCFFFLFQPYVLEMATWPMMAMQFLALTLTILSASMLVRYLDKPVTGRLVIFILFGYASMHASGVGIAMSGAALFTGAGLLLILKYAGAVSENDVKKGLIALAGAAALTAIHGFLMVRGAPVPQAVGEPLSSLGIAIRFFALLMDSIYAGLRSIIWLNGGLISPRFDKQNVDACCGVGFLAISILILVVLMRHYLKTNRKEYLYAFAVIAYPLTALLIYIALIVVRLRSIAPDEAVLPYLIGGRYVIFPSFFMFIMGSAIWLLLFRTIGKFSAILPFFCSISAAIGAAIFVTTEMPHIWPNTMVDHMSAWNNLVQEVKTDTASGNPIKNRILTDIDQDYKPDLFQLQYLLNHELSCINCVKITP
ncbi:MAG: hypothetical protein ACXWE3_14240 [Methylobacter sp.]